MKMVFGLLAFAGAVLLAGVASGEQGVWTIITRETFESMLSHRRDGGCTGAFYTYDAFIEAASKFRGFGTRSSPPSLGRPPTKQRPRLQLRQAGEALGLNLLRNPDMVSTDPVVAFKTAIWFWMTPQASKPSCHAVMTNGWTPSGGDRGAGRLPGYGMTTNIINGGQECGTGHANPRARDRVAYYKRYCGMLGVGYGGNIACMNQKPYGG